MGVAGLQTLEEQGVAVRPSSKVVAFVQDKCCQKRRAFTRRSIKQTTQKAAVLTPFSRFLVVRAPSQEPFALRGVRLGPFVQCPMVESIRNVAADLVTPLMLKSCRGAYDGQGNAVLRTASNALVAAALQELFGKKSLSSESLDPDLLYAEKWVPYKRHA